MRCASVRPLNRPHMPRRLLCRQRSTMGVAHARGAVIDKHTSRHMTGAGSIDVICGARAPRQI